MPVSTLPKTILVIDDAPEILRLFEVLLRSWGFQVVGATTGTAGLDCLSRMISPPAAIICDFRMPDMNGLTVLEQIRQSAAHDLPFVMMSADCSSALLRAAYEQGADEFLPKPFLLPELRILLAGLGVIEISLPDGVPC